MPIPGLPPPPPPPPPLPPFSRSRPPKSLGDPCLEAEIFVRTYAPTQLTASIRSLQDAAFAIATCNSADEWCQLHKGFASSNKAVVLIVASLIQAGYTMCKDEHGYADDQATIYIYNSVYPFLPFVDKKAPRLGSTPDDKRAFIESACLHDGGDELLNDSYNGFFAARILGCFDKLMNRSLTDPDSVSTGFRSALLRFLHVLGDADGELSQREERFIKLIEDGINSHITKGFFVAQEHPDAVDRLGKLKQLFDFSMLEKNPSVQASKNIGNIVSQDSCSDVDEIIGQLMGMTGLESVKKEITSHINTLRVSEMRSEKGLAEIKTTNHMVFLGNPGTGKTSVARLLAKLYRELGILSEGTFIEVDQSSLVAGYVGQTAIKTKALIDEAKGGVLFIDEAYALVSENNQNSFGKEAIDTLLKYMEDYRNDFIVIVAGYQEPMEKFLASNPGLKSRFNKYISFPDFSHEELMNVFEKICQASGYKPSAELREKVALAFFKVLAIRPKHFGNARAVRNLFDLIVVQQANRVISLTSPTHSDLMDLIEDDFLPEHLEACLR